MTLGFVLIFIGIQLHLVKTYVLTPRFSNFLSANAPLNEPPQMGPGLNQAFNMPNINPNNQPNSNYNSPYYQASYPGNNPAMNQPPIQPLAAPSITVPARTFSPPQWFCWPVLFMGTVLLLHGISMRRN